MHVINQCSYQVIKLSVCPGEQVYPAYNFLHSFKAVYVICYIPLADLDLKEWFTNKCSVYYHLMKHSSLLFQQKLTFKKLFLVTILLGWYSTKAIYQPKLLNNSYCFIRPNTNWNKIHYKKTLVGIKYRES